MFGLSLGSENFSIFSPSDKKYLFGSGQKVPRSKTGRPLICVGQKYAWVGSGQVLSQI